MHLIVVTDGVNDVRPGDEPGLLAGPEGLAIARTEIARGLVQVWAVGVGASPNRGELAALSGIEDHAQVLANEPLALSYVLRRIGERISENTRLVIGTNAAAPLALGAGPRRLTVILTDEGYRRELLGEWSPPLLSPPIASRRFAERGVSEGSPLRWWRWGLLFMPLGFVMLAALPVSFVTEVGEHPAGADDHSAGESGGLRPSIQEAPPRRPDEVTADLGERIVRLPPRD